MNAKPSLAAAVAVLLCFSATAHCQSPVGTLRLNSGDFVRGAWVASPEDAADGRVAWRHPDLDRPLVFRTSDVAAIRFAQVQKAAPEGSFRFDLAGGDVCFGTPISSDANLIFVRDAAGDRLPIRRRSVRRMIAIDQTTDEIVVRRGAVADWQDIGERPGGWEDYGDAIVANRPDVVIERRIEMPEIAEIDLNLEWVEDGRFEFLIEPGEKPPDRVAGNPNASVKTLGETVQLTVIDGSLLAIWETEQAADLAVLGEVDSLGGRCQVTVRIDWPSGRMLVLGRDGSVVARLNVPKSDRGGKASWIRLANFGSSLAFHRMDVARLAQLREPGGNDGDTVLTTRDGEIHSGDGIDLNETSWKVSDGDLETSIPLDEVAELRFPTDDVPSDSAAMTLTLRDRTRLSGNIESVTNASLFFQPLALASPVKVPLIDVCEVVAVESAIGVGSRSFPRLFLDGTELAGTWAESADAASIRFQSESAGEVGLRPTAVGKWCRDAPPRTGKTLAELAADAVAKRRRNAPRPVRVAPPAFAGPVKGFFQRAFADKKRNVKRPPRVVVRRPLERDHRLQLRDGQTVSAFVESMDDDYLYFRSPDTDAKRLPRDAIDVIELSDRPVQLLEDDRHRQQLLTVPRVRKKNPPTHLIFAKNGDILRARLVGLDETSVYVETRLEPVTLSRDLIDQIVRVSREGDEADDDLANDETSADPKSPDDDVANRLKVLAVPREGSRMTMRVNRITDGELMGTHELLGDCRVRVADLRSLFIGRWDPSEIESRGVATDWKLVDAPEPTLLDDAGDGGRMPGTGSALVGQPAPDFTLETIDGESFSLAGQTGRVVVLDFWASWCGPCMTAMPIIDNVVAEFNPDQVHLVTVNLQEPADLIRETLERLELEPTVAMDVDGVAAQRYRANAIPQTVVIDREGEVRRVFVGGGSKFGQQLFEAIEEALGS